MADIKCHSCKKKFRIPDSLTPGKKFRCPGCKAVLTVPEPEEEPAEVEEAATDELEEAVEAEEKPAPRDEQPGSSGGAAESEADAWPLVGRGAMMHVIANGAYAFALLLFLLVLFVGSEPTNGRDGRPVGGGGTFTDILTMLMTVAWSGGYLVALGRSWDVAGRAMASRIPRSCDRTAGADLPCGGSKLQHPGGRCENVRRWLLLSGLPDDEIAR